jgi:hypothetical protein
MQIQSGRTIPLRKTFIKKVIATYGDVGGELVARRACVEAAAAQRQIHPQQLTFPHLILLLPASRRKIKLIESNDECRYLKH